MFRNLTYYWRINLAVALAVAVCTAVLTGALLVGDSVRASLRDLTLDRLGSIDLALVAERFFREQLATELAAVPEFAASFDATVPAVILRGNAIHADSRARASQVNVMGVDERFVDLFSSPATTTTFREAQTEPATTELDFERGPGQMFPSIVINAALQDELDAEIGDQLLVHFQLGSEIPRDTLLGSRDTSEVIGTLRATVTAVIPDRGIGRFSLSPHQMFPLNAYVALGQLQSALEQPGRVNAILVHGVGSAPADPQPSLRQATTLADVGLKIVPVGGANSVAVQSDEFVLRQSLVDAIDAAARSLQLQSLPLQAYLANSMRIGDRLLPYSMVLAIDNPTEPTPFGQLVSPAGEPHPALGDQDILLNEWAADDLGATPGDRLQMDYYVVGPDEVLRTEQREFTVAGVVAMRGLAVDPDLTPEYPGIAGVNDIAQWDPPFPVDLAVVRDKDERYWDEYRGAPKAFVSTAVGRQLWSTRYGATTAVRLGGAGSASGSTADLGAALLEHLNLPQYGLRFLEVKASGLEASGGATDFGGLFIAFSFFIIISAVMIVALLFALGIEQRSGSVGLLLAIGYPLAKVRRSLLLEGLTVAAIGAAVGSVGAVLYGRLLLLGLTTIWLPAVGSPLLYLHVLPLTLVAGWLGSLFVVSTSIWWTLRRLRGVPATRLLAGTFAAVSKSTAGKVRRDRILATVGAGAAVALLAYGLATGAATSPGLAFGIGASLMIGSLSAFSLWCRQPRGRLAGSGARAALAMAARNSGWSPTRSILSVALVASASFVIVTVAGNIRDPQSETGIIEAGAGGYALMATADVPLHHDLNAVAGRFELGFDDSAAATLTGVEVTPMRLLPGDDASCLNLYRPQRPRILGVPAAQIERGGFHFGGSMAAQLGVADNPWTLLDVDLGPGIIPAIGDANSTQWIMHIGLGDDVLIDNERGETVRLRLVGTVTESIFQSELLISEANFLEHFPSQSGFSYFLIDVPEGRAEPVAALLEETLSRFGFDTTSTAAKIAGYLVVQNTYLSTFMMLGGLGLLLGTVGLGIVLVRNVIDRRGELATLRAFGFRRAFLARMVLVENAFLLLIGVAIGTLSALLAISPRFLLGSLELPWATLVPTLAAVVLVGLSASIIAVLGALRVPLLPALKADR